MAAMSYADTEVTARRLSAGIGALDVIYTGRFLRAAEALAIGLVDEVVPASEVCARAVAYATRFVSGPLLAYGAAKRTVAGGLDTDLRTGLDLESELFAGLFASKDRPDGMQSFMASAVAADGVDEMVCGFAGRWASDSRMTISAFERWAA
jgi:enoyl-CoA hydratase/carnithine racemase